MCDHLDYQNAPTCVRSIDGGAILSGEASAISGAITALVRVVKTAGTNGVTMLDPISELKLNQIGKHITPDTDVCPSVRLCPGVSARMRCCSLPFADLASSVRERSHLRSLLREHHAHGDPALPEMFAMVWSERTLAGKLSAMLRTMSSASLAQLPEFEQRVKVGRFVGLL